MNKLIIALAIALTSISAHAMTEKTPMDLCIAYEKTSRLIMENRQDGMPLAKMLKAAKTDSTRNRIITAYKVNFFSTPEYKQRAIEAYANTSMIQCLDSFKK